MSRIFDLTSGAPRVWEMVDDSVQEHLIHRAYIQRQIRQAGTTLGTPNYTVQNWGPYPARLSTPDGSNNRQPDRWVDGMHRSLAIASDIAPTEGDYVLVFAPFLPLTTVNDFLGNDLGYDATNAGRFRIVSVVEPRNAHWAAETMPLWRVELRFTKEF